MTTTFGYGRVSTTEQTSENQRRDIENAGYEVGEGAGYWFADEGVSGAVPAMQRPAFVAMVGHIRAGERLVVSKLDRLGRDAQDVGATLKMLTTRNVEVIVLQLGKLDLTSAAGKLMLSMLAAVAEIERDLLVERTQSGLARAKAQGKVLGRPVKTTAADREAIIAKRAAGATISSLARAYSVSRATVLRINGDIAT